MEVIMKRKNRPKRRSLNFNTDKKSFDQWDLRDDLKALELPKEEFHFLLHGYRPSSLCNFWDGLRKSAIKESIEEIIKLGLPTFIDLYQKNKKIGPISKNSDHTFYYAVEDLLFEGLGKGLETRSKDLRKSIKAE
jgi:hypothetical protein